MDKIKEAREILKRLGLPVPQQNEMAALTLLALCDLGPEDDWNSARRNSLGVSKGIMSFMKTRYGKKYAPNTRETVRRQVLHQFVQAKLAAYNPDVPNLPTNSPRAHYALTEDALRVVKNFGGPGWEKACRLFLSTRGSLTDKYQKRKSRKLVPVVLPDGQRLHLSSGSHNLLQAAVISQFVPRFASGARILYMGDTAEKELLLDVEGLDKLGLTLSDHGKLPDIIFHDESKSRLFLVEAVTSHGPMSPKRHIELMEAFEKSRVPLVFLTAFPSFAVFRKHVGSIAWETEVWIAEAPDHIIHFDGEKFISTH